jgi:hypothetical protein
MNVPQGLVLVGAFEVERVFFELFLVAVDWVEVFFAVVFLVGVAGLVFAAAAFAGAALGAT